MNKLALLSFVGAIALVSVAQAAPKDDPMVTISGAKSEMQEQSRAMSADEFSRFAGSYELSNGSSIALFTRGQKKYAALHGEAWHELAATSSNTFVAKDHQLKIDIWRDDNGVVSGDVYIPKSDVQTADGGTGTHLVKVAFH
jgi:hypothetical protein